jgi:chromosome segregation ATPase
MKGMNNLDFWERLTSIVVALLALVGGPLGFLFGRRQRNADANKTEADAGKTLAEIFQVHATARNMDAKTLVDIAAVYQGIIDELRKEMGELNGRVDKMEKELETAQGELRLARDGLIERDRRLADNDKKMADMQRHITQLEEKLKGKEDKA